MTKAVILAAGKGTRLKPVTNDIPKVMIPVNGKPVLEYHIEQLAKARIKKIFINLHHLPEKIKKYIGSGDRWNIEIIYSFEPEILGTAGAIKNIEKNIGPDPFLVVYGDNFLELDLSKFIKYSISKGGIGTIAVFEKDDVTGGGIVAIEKKNRITRFLEKPSPSEVFSHWVSAGVFFFSNRIFEFIGHGYSDLGYDILPKILEQEDIIFAYKLDSKVWAIDSIDLLNDLERHLKQRDI